ncbi:alpha/beta fold hydrolase [Nocardioides caldifontis]|uniref:alpha/beta fold hydrolase n=1 Tax=Nocardioides caldifontis TaxID=2588938 RepID=UPI0011DFF35B|nr:alpha/beta fold hydrolase [Nocardioides caldifontis]
MPLRTTLAAGLAALATLAATQVVPGSTAEAAPPLPGPGHTQRDGCLTSVPDPGTSRPVEICYTVFKPAGASRRAPVPLLMHSHGWGGSRATKVADVQRYLDAGYGVLSYDQRGWGESGGHAHVENPAVEGHDVRALVGVVGKLRWVRQDGPGDPRMGAVGGSYGGGYQLLGAFEELRTRGKPVFDALAPEITWNDLNDSLAPEGVVRTEWALALSAASLPFDALPANVYKALVEGAATGYWPDGRFPLGEDMETFFDRNGPSWHVRDGRRLDIPVLFGQGTTDSLFNLQQGLTNWRTALTPRARKRSMLVGYNGGHVLPTLLPRGVEVTSDPCSERLGGGDFTALSLKFFDEVLKGRDWELRGYGKVHLATRYSTCTTVRSVAPDTAFPVRDVATSTGVGLPIAVEVAKGPLRIAGSAYLSAKVSTLLPDSRAFLGLAIGRSPLDATLVQNNVMPLNEPKPVSRVQRRIELPAVAVDVPEHQRLFLMVSPISDTFLVMGSRLPGAVRLQDAKVHLSVVG